MSHPNTTRLLNMSWLNINSFNSSNLEVQWWTKEINSQIWRKIKNCFKLNKWILYVYLNSFYYLISIIEGLRKLKIYKNFKKNIIFDFLLYFLR